MDKTLLWKVIVAATASVCVMVLAMTGKVEGPAALTAIQWIVGPFFAGAAALGIGQAVAGALSSSTPAPTPKVTP